VGNLTATFINRNTAAAYLGSCSVVWLLLLSSRVRRHLPPGQFAPADLRAVFADRPLEISAPLCGFVLCVTAMFLTGSRAGVMLSLLAISIAFAVELERQLPQRRRLLMAVAASGAGALILFEFLGGRVNDRFTSQGLVDSGRLESYRAIVQMIADRPWFGTGLGTFPSAFAAYRSAKISMWGVWDIAHNTTLEIAAEVGIPLAVGVVVGWAAIFAVLIRGASIRRRDRIIPLAALCVALIAVLHSIIDFSLQIPGYSIVACALVGTGLAQSFRSQRSPAKPPAPP
jgi:O-antigen ligase